NRIPLTVISVLSVSSWPSVSISSVIALRIPMTRVMGAGRGVLPTWATLTDESNTRNKEKTQSDLRIGLIVAPYRPAGDHGEAILSRGRQRVSGSADLCPPRRVNFVCDL